MSAVLASGADPVEARFDLDELFFSRTDTKGIITSGNDVFVRVSGYSKEELLGRPHNVVRHPDMPRAVFRVLWDRLQAGLDVAAYVRNRAADGSYYWVLATVDQAAGGFLSVRLKPSSELFALARSAYEDVLAVEQRVEGGDVRRRKAAIDAGVERLLELLDGAGFSDYHEFMRAIVPLEVGARESVLGTSACERLGGLAADAGDVLAPLVDTCVQAHAALDRVGANLERYAALHDELAPKSEYVRQLSSDMRLFSLNALLKATRLGDRGIALGAVAEIMRRRSQTTGPVTDALRDDIAGAMDLLGAMGYRVAVSKLQAEMMLVFLHELIGDRGHETGKAVDLRFLADGLDRGTRRLCTALADLTERLAGLSRSAGRLGTELRVLAGLEINGRIEASRLNDAEGVLDLFQSIGRQVGAAHEQLGSFSTIGRQHAADDRAITQQLLAGLTRLEQQMSQLSA